MQPDLGLKPLSGRSVVLSALLGSHPPRLPARALVALGGQFGIAEGTVRTALSRMVDNGELEARGSTYSLGARLRRRREAQEVALHVLDEPWDGSWWISVVDAVGRPMAARRAYRATLLDHRMGELRPDTWLRPANLPAPPSDEGAFVVRGEVTDRAAKEIASRLWDLAAVADHARRLLKLAEHACTSLAPGDPGALADSFLVSVATVRFLRSEPQLPREIVGEAWPADQLRATYGRLEPAYATVLAGFVAEQAAT
jgi:phenylacetic acid degradation operon negative regulatory protein